MIRATRPRRLRTIPALAVAALLIAAGILIALAGMRVVVTPAASAPPPSGQAAGPLL